MSGSIMNTGFNIRSMPLFPIRTRRNIQYYEAVSFACGASLAGGYVFSANGCFDPNVTGTGGQPMGFDQAMTFYNHYTVLRSRISVVFQSEATNIRLNAALSVSGSNTITTSIEQLMENGNITFRTLEYAGAMGGAAALTRSMSPAKYQGIQQVLDDPNMRGDSASNPSEQAYFHLSTWNVGSAVTAFVTAQVLLEYDVMFTEPRKGSLSVTRPVPMSPYVVETKEPPLEEIERGILSLLKSRRP